jgi:S-adenosylmethionine decarboxylase
MTTGCAWIVEAYGCAAQHLTDCRRFEALFDALITDLNLHPVAEPVWHQFPPPGGITGFAVLAESHLACHSFPEHGTLCLDLFCCRPRDGWEFEAELRERFGATSVTVRRLDRPLEL